MRFRAKKERCYYCSDFFPKTDMREINIGLYTNERVLVCEKCFSIRIENRSNPFNKLSNSINNTNKISNTL